MPLNGRGNYHYFYDYAPFRVVTVNTEEDYSTGSAQWLWLDAALGSTDRSVTPWLFLSLHRPVLSADASEAGAHVPGGALSVALEPLLFKHKVDVIFQGHQHCYDRTASVYNGGWGAHGCGALRAHAPPLVHHALPTPPFHPRDCHGHARREQRLHLAARAHLHQPGDGGRGHRLLLDQAHPRMVACARVDVRLWPHDAVDAGGQQDVGVRVR